VRKAKLSAGVIDLASAKGAYDAGAVFVDVREVEEWRQGHIRHAVHIPRGLLEFQVER
jgi:rhodanese-related sulfurtransferase